MFSLDVVLVTYNRLEKLKHALQCYSQQTVGFRNLIVVNNCSTDGTADYLDEWAQREDANFHKIVIHSAENVGGSGGFYLGQQRAVELDADWVFVADDDAYPDADMVEQFHRFVESHDVSRLSAICGAVLNMDRTYYLPFRAKVVVRHGIGFDLDYSKEEDYTQDYFPIDILTYVGSFMRGESLKRVGLVNKDLFIYFDDTEHSLRLRKDGEIWCVPAIKIMHERGATITDDAILASWRDYYRVRNKKHMLLKHYPLCYYNELRHFIQSLLTRREKFDARSKMIYRAYKDAFFGHLGMHKLYKPGWEIRNENGKGRSPISA